MPQQTSKTTNKRERQNSDERICPISMANQSQIDDKYRYIIGNVMYDVRCLYNWVVTKQKNNFPHNRQQLSATELEKLKTQYNNLPENDKNQNNSSSTVNDASFYYSADDWTVPNFHSSPTRFQETNNALVPQTRSHSGGAKQRIKYKNKNYVIHTGSRGGKYILLPGKNKLYVKTT